MNIGKFFSRRLLLCGLIFACPIVYKSFDITEAVTLTVTGCLATYILGRAYTDRKSG